MHLLGIFGFSCHPYFFRIPNSPYFPRCMTSTNHFNHASTTTVKSPSLHPYFPINIGTDGVNWNMGLESGETQTKCLRARARRLNSPRYPTRLTVLKYVYDFLTSPMPASSFAGRQAAFGTFCELYSRKCYLMYPDIYFTPRH